MIGRPYVTPMLLREQGVMVMLWVPDYQCRLGPWFQNVYPFLQ